MPKPDKCLVPKCPKPAKVRGLCCTCHAGARAEIKLGRTTWAELEELNLARAKRPRGAFRLALIAAKKRRQ